MSKAILTMSFQRSSSAHRLWTALTRSGGFNAFVKAFCHSSSDHNGNLRGYLSSIFLPNHTPASNAMTISFGGDIHFVFVRVAIPFSFLAVSNFNLPQAAPMRLWSV
jgi:hypothetical protein